jgi:hypothetical protein
MTTCAALLATYFAGLQIADLDKTRVYTVLAMMMAQMTATQRMYELEKSGLAVHPAG